MVISGLPLLNIVQPFKQGTAFRVPGRSALLVTLETLQVLPDAALDGSLG
jgi:hypothetical protein